MLDLLVSVQHRLRKGPKHIQTRYSFTVVHTLSHNSKHRHRLRRGCRLSRRGSRGRSQSEREEAACHHQCAAGLGNGEVCGLCFVLLLCASMLVAVQPVFGMGSQVTALFAASDVSRLKECYIHTAIHMFVMRSGVAKERKVFMDLMRNEIDRVNTVLSKSGEGEWFLDCVQWNSVVLLC